MEAVSAPRARMSSKQAMEQQEERVVLLLRSARQAAAVSNVLTLLSAQLSQTVWQTHAVTTNAFAAGIKILKFAMEN